LSWGQEEAFGVAKVCYFLDELLPKKLCIVGFSENFSNQSRDHLVTASCNRSCSIIVIISHETIREFPIRILRSDNYPSQKTARAGIQKCLNLP
jgi:hypothetical protein